VPIGSSIPSITVINQVVAARPENYQGLFHGAAARVHRKLNDEFFSRLNHYRSASMIVSLVLQVRCPGSIMAGMREIFFNPNGRKLYLF
jgi:hypothetical protein